VGILVVGMVLLAVEVIVLPGFGVAGVLGLAAIVVALVRIFEESALPVLGYGVVFGGVLMAVLLWMLPNSRLAAIFRLSDRLPSSGGTAGTVSTVDRVDLLGAIGTAITDLRPAGVARFGNDRVDVVSEGDYISVGSPITVLRVEGSRVTVRQVDTGTNPIDPRGARTGAEQSAADSGREEA